MTKHSDTVKVGDLVTLRPGLEDDSLEQGAVGLVVEISADLLYTVLIGGQKLRFNEYWLLRAEG